MGAKHKLQHSRVEITSHLDSQQMLSVSEEVASSLTQRRGKVNGGHFFQFGWTVTDRSPEALRMTLGNPRKPVMSYEVLVAGDESGGRLTSRITGFRTSQPTFMFVPTGPKRLLGYQEYRNYLVALGQAFEAADPTCQVRIIERPA